MTDIRHSFFLYILNLTGNYGANFWNRWGRLHRVTCVEMIESGYEVVVVDNLCNSLLESLRRVEELVRMESRM